MKKLLLYSPVNRQIGGTGLLLSRICSILSLKHGYSLYIVDYEQGGVASYFREKGIPFVLIRQESQGDFKLIDGTFDYIVTNLLSAKHLEPRIIGNDKARIFFWMTFPADAYKWLPLSTMLNGMPIWWRRLIVHFHRAQSKRIGLTLSRGMRGMGIALMDEECWNYTNALFSVEGPPNVVPICSSESTGLITRKPREKNPEVVWIGRLEDFKTAALSNVLSAFNLNIDKCPLGTIHIIGDGKDRKILEARASGNFGRLKIIFHGHLNPSEMKRFLRENADLFIGHGTSILEAASMGIPSLLVDPSYLTLTSDIFRASWFKDVKPGGVGRIIEDIKDYTGSSWPLLYAEYISEPSILGLSCRTHWDKCHNPINIAERVNSQFITGTYTLGDFRIDGGSIPDCGGKLIEVLKRSIKALKN